MVLISSCQTGIFVGEIILHIHFVMNKNPVFYLIISVNILFFTGASFAQPSFMMVDNITQNAGYLAALNLEQFQKGEAEEAWAHAALDSSAQCLKDLDKFSKSPDAATQKFKLTFHPNDNPEEKELTTAEVQDFVMAMYAGAKLSDLKRKLEQDVLNSLVWYEDMASETNKLEMAQLDVAKMTGEGMQKYLKEVKALGLEEKATTNAHEHLYTFSQMSEMADFIASAGKKKYDAFMEARNAVDKPYLAKLTGISWQPSSPNLREMPVFGNVMDQVARLLIHLKRWHLPVHGTLMEIILTILSRPGTSPDTYSVVTSFRRIARAGE